MLRPALPKFPSRFTPLGTRDVTGGLTASLHQRFQMLRLSVLNILAFKDGAASAILLTEG
jgi:hypothetical protein